MELEIMKQVIALGPSGVMIVAVYCIARYFTKQLDQRDERLKDITEKMLTIIETNTKALTELSLIIRERKE